MMSLMNVMLFGNCTYSVYMATTGNYNAYTNFVVQSCMVFLNLRAYLSFYHLFSKVKITVMLCSLVLLAIVFIMYGCLQ